MKIELSQNAWYGDEPITIELPETWDVEYCGMPADDYPALTTYELRDKFAHPIGTKRVSDLAQGKKEVVIIFDDMSRATPAEPLAELILEELHAAGIANKSIRFICALGSHGAMSRDDFAKKLGARIVREYAVFNHNCYENCVKAGVTTRGVTVEVNAEVMRCDLKIGIGSITPHPVNGYGGGGKIIMPGVSSIGTIERIHKAAALHAKNAGIGFVEGTGNLENKGMRLEIEEGVRMVGLDMKVDAIINSRREIVDLIVGDPIEGYYTGVKRSSILNVITKRPSEKDVVIVNANSKSNEAAIALAMAQAAVKLNGDIVIVDHNAGRSSDALSFRGLRIFNRWSDVARRERPFSQCWKGNTIYSPIRITAARYRSATPIRWFSLRHGKRFSAFWQAVMSIVKRL